jgi:hypothetical protein
LYCKRAQLPLLSLDPYNLYKSLKAYVFFASSLADLAAITGPIVKL